MKFLGFEIHRLGSPARDTHGPATQQVHKARAEAYRQKHAELLAELAPRVPRPLPAVERIARG